ncbi:MAG: hypothetical protein AB1716_20350, partial [Planctomycetota bacterium]
PGMDAQQPNESDACTNASAEGPGAPSVTLVTPPEFALCRNCNYLLRGLPEPRCPECGQPFDPRDPATMNLGKRISPRTRRWLLPFGRKHVVAVVGAAVLTLIACVPPGTYFLLLFPLTFFWVGVVAWWLMRVLAGVIIALHYRQPPLWRYPHARRWLVTPLVFATMIALLSFEVPFRVGFWISRPALDRFALSVLDQAAASHPDRRVGLYRAEDINVHQGLIEFRVGGTGFLDFNGFAYFADQRAGPPAGTRREYTPLGDGWYTWWEDF